MSLVIAEIKDGVVYFGADTQTSMGNTDKLNRTSKGNLKVKKLPNGILVGHAGKVQNAQLFSCHREWFEDLPEGKLTKEFIVTKIVPAYYRALKQRKMLKNEEPADSDCSLFLAQEDRLFRIGHDFSVFTIPKSDAIGCGNYAYYSTNTLKPDLTVRDKMLKVLRLSEAHDTTIGAPFVFIDTKNLEYEFVEE